MLYNCSSLDKIPNISKLKYYNKVTHMNGMLGKCTSLKTLPDFSGWDISSLKYKGVYLKDFSSAIPVADFKEFIEYEDGLIRAGMFEGCYSLESLPDISKLDFSKVATIDFLFSSYRELKALPDILKWDTSDVIHMDGVRFTDFIFL